MILIALIIHYLRITCVGDRISVSNSFHSHPLKPCLFSGIRTRNLVSFGAKYSSTGDSLWGSSFFLRFSRYHHIRDHLPPYGNFLSHFVRRPTSAFHCPTHFALHVGNVLVKHIPVLLWPVSWSPCYPPTYTLVEDNVQAWRQTTWNNQAAELRP